MKSPLLLAVAALVLCGTVAHAAGNPAAAQSVTKACAAKYQADKAANKLNGQTWTQYLSACGKADVAPAMADVKAEAKAAKAEMKAEMKAKAEKAMAKAAPAAGNKQPTPGQEAMYERMRKCGDMWKADKAAGKTGKQTWPQYWDVCSDRLKK